MAESRFIYRVVMSQTRDKFDLIKVNLRGMCASRINRWAGSYEEIRKSALGYASSKKLSYKEDDPFEKFCEEYPRHAWVINQMCQESKDRWIYSLFSGRIREPERLILWESASTLEEHPGLKIGGVSIDFRGAISGGKVSTGDAMDLGKTIGPDEGKAVKL